MTQLALSRAVLDRLAHVSSARGAPSLGERLASLDRWVRADLVAFEAEIAALPRGTRVVHAAAHHLLDLRGKHLRPLCVALTSRFGDGFTEQARGLAVAVELVHSATLLHDDVVDVAERRRGEPAACVVYGNAASIFAGDWLLVAALRRIAATGVEGVLDRMLGVIDEMIVAESLQLERRGNVTGARDDYFAIVEGKTAALFRWAMIAGARVARLAPGAEAALERFGFHLGVAFQAVDDELDFADERSEEAGGGGAAGATGGAGSKAPRGINGTGKDPLADLREGKITYPLVVALEREPALRPRLEALLAETQAGIEPPREALAAIAATVRATGALTATRALAEEHVERALAVLDELPAGPPRDALATVALASLQRTS
jgi:octaprenyl-diphosphate synthase